MFGLMLLLLLVALVALVVGLINPKLVLRWEKDENKWTRKNVVKYFLSATIIFFILMVVFAVIGDEGEIEEPNEITEEAPEVEEPQLKELNEEDRALFNTPLENLSELSYDELQEMVSLIDDKEDYTDEDRELMIKNDEKIKEEYANKKAEKEEQEAKEKAEKEAKDEEERIAQEKKDEEEKLAREKEEAEKYETGITYEDMARDKDGLSGEYVKFKGRVIQVMEGSGYMQYRLATSGNYDNVILIQIYDELLDRNILEDDTITVEGISTGNITYTTVMGAEQNIPSMLVDNLYQ